MINGGVINGAALNAAFGETPNVIGTGSLTLTGTVPVVGIVVNTIKEVDSGSLSLSGKSLFPYQSAAASTVANADSQSSYFVMDLLCPNYGIQRVPITSWQLTYRIDSQGYAQCVVYSPDTYATYIADADGFKVSQLITVDGVQREYVIFSEDLERTDYAQGTNNYSVVLVGYPAAVPDPGTPDPANNTTLQDIRTIFSGTQGYRVRCKGNPLMYPGYNAYIDEVIYFKAEWVNYYAPGDDFYMDVGARPVV